MPLAIRTRTRPGPRQSRLRREPNRFKRLFQILGPGLITGASDDDPSGVGTYSIAGAALGYQLLWVGLYSIPLMVTVQTMVSRLGLVTGDALATTLRRHYSIWLLYPLVLGLVVSNTITAGADLGAIGEAVHLFAPLPGQAVVIVVAIGIVAGLALGGYGLINRTFKWLTLVLFAYVGAGLLARPDPGAVLRGTFLPTLSFDQDSLSNVVALLGATVSPYMLFWQSQEEVEDEVELGRTSRRSREGTTRTELRYAFWDVTVGMVFSQLITFFVQLATAATLNQQGRTDIESAGQAAEALRPLAGDAAGLLFAIGIIGAGCLAVPILLSGAAFAVANTFGWRSGLEQRFETAPRFYATIGLLALVGVGLSFVGINPIHALFLASLIFGLLTPPLVVVLLLIMNRKQIMGRYTNGPWLNAFGILALLTNTVAVVGFLLTGRG